MSKDYHKGIKLQVYVSEALNEKINKGINQINKDRKNLPFPEDDISKSDFIRNALKWYLTDYLDIDITSIS